MTVARVLLAFVIGMVLWATVPVLFGWRSDVVLTGSMSPRIEPGDVVVTQPVPPSSLTPGQVVSFDDQNVVGRTVLHRIRVVNPDGSLVTRGDANPTDDSQAVTPDEVNGLGRLRVRFVGLPVVWAREGDLLPLGLAIFILGAALVLVLGDRENERDARAADDSGAPRDDSTGNDLTDPDPDPDPSKGEGCVDISDATIALRTAGIMVAHSGLPSSALDRGWFALRRFQFPRPFNLAPATALFAIGLGLAIMLGGAHAAFAATAKNSANSWAISPYAQFGAGTYVTAVNNSNPLFFYRLNQATGPNATDSSGNGNTGTYVGAWNYSVSPQPLPRNAGLAVSSAGSTSCISSPNRLNNPTRYSYEIWFRTTSTTGGKLAGFEILQTGTSSQYDRHLYMTNTGRLVFGVWLGTPTTITSPLSYNDGQWHQAAVTMGTTGGMQLFVDGFAVASNANTASENYRGYWRFGCGQLGGWPNYPTDPAATTFNGAIANVSVYTAELTPTDIRNHYFAS